ncbi:MAG: hypothetical protein C0614_00035 [Desulfuromonas sp.]|nr:MAG: hypothetical protein C0614_00035 [Desulfuromonas sp.]
MHATYEVAEVVLLTVSLLLIASLLLLAIKRTKLPLSVALVVTGIIIGQISDAGPHWLSLIIGYEISPEIILYVFLPALVYESAFHLNLRQLNHNVYPVMGLAVPGLIISTGVIGWIVWMTTPIDLTSALLLGSILSATDPVAVISLFKKLGAPQRLTILVEGESLFNDATSIVVARIIIGIIAANHFSVGLIVDGLYSFLTVFSGGLLVGLLSAWLIGMLLKFVENDSFVEISLTTILAYLSFIVAEEIFHVSGVMATVAAGITMGNWGRSKISPAVAGYMENFWEYVASVANALIFLMVGLRVDLMALLESVDLLFWVIVAMLISRAIVIFCLVPLTGRIPGTEPVGKPYQAVMFWGGLRGAIALAIVLSLDDFPMAETFVALVMGAVLFTLLVQGTTIEKLVRFLKLDQPPLAERMARTAGILHAKEHALNALPQLRNAGHFSGRIAGQTENRLKSEIRTLRDDIEDLRASELDPEQEKVLLFCRCFDEEKSFYYDLFSQGHMSEQAYRDLIYSLDLQKESLRSGLAVPRYTLHPPTKHPIFSCLMRYLDKAFKWTPLPENIRASQIAREYEEAWGRAQGSQLVLADLEKTEKRQTIHHRVMEEVVSYYRNWFTHSREYLDNTATQFPEFVNAMQERLAGRLLIHAQREVIEEEIRSGVIPNTVAEKILEDLAGEIRVLRGKDMQRLHLEASELLRKIEFFREVPDDEFALLAAKLHPYTIPAGHLIIEQGDTGDSLYLISRGVVRVSRLINGDQQDLATLMAGDFFGEMALLHATPRTATCRSATPSVLYELRRSDFDEVRSICPSLQLAMEKADQERTKVLASMQ